MKENEASSTAFTVLQGILHVAYSTPHQYLVDKDIVETGELILKGSEEGRKRLKQITSPLSKLSTKLREYLLLPGITVHYVLRKSYIEEQALKAISEGVTQVVNLGAGFDTLAWRLHHVHSQVNFIEIDHPDTHKVKSEALLSDSSNKKDNMHFLSVDFTQQDLYSALDEFSAFDATRKTLYICEGVMMYLEVDEVNAIFSAIDKLTGADSLLLFTCLEPQHSPKNNVRSLLFSYLNMIGEPIKWELESQYMNKYLADKNCKFLALADTPELKKHFITHDSNYVYHEGEYLVLCRF
ncbi:class I SAM-dependent methyltransferase [Algibacillus agarilyticus]|uniref:class I SAM-dependent methyltransferase n=1 Tax=Algibacillus agarilyticus TaxID=2234133 RepID=UPI000DD0EBEA|nr:class I SAM-dependent methyltransferase [Algibacillus agarilyticus]